MKRRLSPASRWSGLKFLHIYLFVIQVRVSGFALEWIEIKTGLEDRKRVESPASRWSGLKYVGDDGVLYHTVVSGFALEWIEIWTGYPMTGSQTSLRLRAGVD